MGELDNNQDVKRTSSSSLGTIFLTVLILLFFSIIFVSVFVVGRIQDTDNYIPALVFMIVNAVALIAVIGYGSTLLKSMHLVNYISSVAITAIYTLVHYIHLFLTYSIVSMNSYVLFHLILVFIYLLIIFPTALVGINHKNNNY